MSESDPQLAELGRALLEHAGAFDVALCSLLEKLKATQTTLEKAKKQTKDRVITMPHAAAGMSSVVATSSASGAQPLTQAEALALLQRQQQQQAKARAALSELGTLFRLVGERLEDAGAVAAEISSILYALSR